MLDIKFLHYSHETEISVQRFPQTFNIRIPTCFHGSHAPWNAVFAQQQKYYEVADVGQFPALAASFHYPVLQGNDLGRNKHLCGCR